tara:strand:- start:7829 stop:10177 length:2349 start_codon:yes stop_codon:yes gene_type:complete
MAVEDYSGEGPDVREAIRRKRKGRQEELDAQRAGIDPSLAGDFEAVEKLKRQNILRAYTEASDRQKGLAPGAPGSMTYKVFGESLRQSPQREQQQLRYVQILADLDKYQMELESGRLSAETRRRAKDGLSSLRDKLVGSQTTISQTRLQELSREGEALNKTVAERMRSLRGGDELPADRQAAVTKAVRAFRDAVDTQSDTQRSREDYHKSGEANPALRKWKIYENVMAAAVSDLTPEQQMTIYLHAAYAGNTTAGLMMEHGSWDADRNPPGKATNSSSTLKDVNENAKQTQSVDQREIEKSIGRLSDIDIEKRREGSASGKRVAEEMFAYDQTMAELEASVEAGEPVDSEAARSAVSVAGLAAEGVSLEEAEQLVAHGEPEDAEQTVRGLLKQYESDPDHKSLSDFWRGVESTGEYEEWIANQGYSNATPSFQRRAFIRAMNTIQSQGNREARAMEAANILTGQTPATPLGKSRALLRSVFNPYYTKDLAERPQKESASLSAAWDPNVDSDDLWFGEPEAIIKTPQERGQNLKEAAVEEAGEELQTWTDPTPKKESDWGGVTYTRHEDGAISYTDPETGKEARLTEGKAYDHLEKSAEWGPASEDPEATEKAVETAGTPEDEEGAVDNVEAAVEEGDAASEGDSPLDTMLGQIDTELGDARRKELNVSAAPEGEPAEEEAEEPVEEPAEEEAIEEEPVQPAGQTVQGRRGDIAGRERIETPEEPSAVGRDLAPDHLSGAATEPISGGSAGAFERRLKRLEDETSQRTEFFKSLSERRNPKPE